MSSCRANVGLAWWATWRFHPKSTRSWGQQQLEIRLPLIRFTSSVGWIWRRLACLAKRMWTKSPCGVKRLSPRIQLVTWLVISFQLDRYLKATRHQCQTVFNLIQLISFQLLSTRLWCFFRCNVRANYLIAAGSCIIMALPLLTSTVSCGALRNDIRNLVWSLLFEKQLWFKVASELKLPWSMIMLVFRTVLAGVSWSY